MLFATLGRWVAVILPLIASAARYRWLRGKPRKLAGKHMPRCPITGAGRNSPAMLPAGVQAGNDTNRRRKCRLRPTFSEVMRWRTSDPPDLAMRCRSASGKKSFEAAKVRVPAEKRCATPRRAPPPQPVFPPPVPPGASARSIVGSPDGTSRATLLRCRVRWYNAGRVSVERDRNSISNGRNHAYYPPPGQQPRRNRTGGCP